MNFLEKLLRQVNTAPRPGKLEPGTPAEPRPTENIGNFLKTLRGQGVNYGTPQDNDTREYGPADDLTDFLTGKLALNFDSSWVASALYVPGREALRIEFKDGHVEVYGEISEEEAKEFATTHSKGKWLWRVVHGGFLADKKHWVHKKPRLAA